MSERRRIIGIVTGNKTARTVTVEITRKFRHPLYGKVVISHKRVKAHDELGCKLGDEVRIVESRPLSKTKRWVVEAILKSDERRAEELAARQEAAQPVVEEE